MTIADQGTVNLLSLVTPDLIVQRVSPAIESITGAPSDIIAVVGTASDGPVNQWVPGNTYADFQSSHGDLNARKHDLGTQVATAITTGGSDFVILRVSDGTDTVATVNAVTVSGNTTTTAATITSINTGSRNNKATLTLTTGAKALTIKAVAAVNGVWSETYENIDASNAALFWGKLVDAINNGTPDRPKSARVKAVLGTSVNLPTLPYSVTLSGGTDGAANANSSTLLGIDGVTPTGMYALRGSGHSVLVLADADDPAIWGPQDQFARSEGSFALIQMADNDTAVNADTVKRTAGFDTRQSKTLFGDYKLWRDPVNQTNRYVSQQGFTAGLRGTLTPNLSTLNANGGRFPMTSIIGGRKASYSQSELNILARAGIDTIKNPSVGGPYYALAMGNTSSSNPAEVDEINTTMNNFIDRSFNAVMGKFVGIEASDENLAIIEAALNSLPSNMLSTKMLSLQNGKLPWRIVCSKVNNPDSLRDLGYIQADISIHFNSTVRFLILNTLGGSTVQPN